MTDTIKQALDDIRKAGWAVSIAGQLREEAAKGGDFYCAVYPAIFGREVWSEEDGKGYHVVTPRLRGTGSTLLMAIDSASLLIINSPEGFLYRELNRAWRDNYDARCGRASGRTENGEAGEEARLERL